MSIANWLKAKVSGIMGASLLIVLAISAVQSVTIWRRGLTIAGLETDLRTARATLKSEQDEVRIKTVAAKVADAANVSRVKAEQAKISEERIDAYRARIDALNARVEQLRRPAGGEAGSGQQAAVMSASGEAAGGAGKAACGDGFSLELRATATAQAIQLDEVIKWAEEQGLVDNSGTAEDDLFKTPEAAIQPR